MNLKVPKDERIIRLAENQSASQKEPSSME
jgi:hypothetical protein